MTRLAAFAIVGLLACGGDDFSYLGEPGAPVPAAIDAWVPSVTATITGIDGDGVAVGGRFLIDTGAPFTIVDTDEVSAGDGLYVADVDAFELTFPDYDVIVFDVFAYQQTDPRLGIIGGDLLSRFALTVDYKGERAWLDDAPGTLPRDFDPAEVDAPQVVPARVRGGGRALVPGECPDGCGSLDVPATRFLVEIDVEDAAIPRWALVDTGATSVVVDEAFLAELDAPDRPVLDGVTVGTATGSVTAYFTRMGSIRLADVAETSVPALVLPGTGLFDAVSDEIGVDVVALIGGHFLRNYLTTIDYTASELSLARYLAPTHVDPDEFIGVGFTLIRGDGGWTVQDVYTDTDAARAGVQRGDVVAELDGRSIGSLGGASVGAILDSFQLGETIDVGLDRPSGIVTVAVEIEDLLPRYEGP